MIAAKSGIAFSRSEVSISRSRTAAPQIADTPTKGLEPCRGIAGVKDVRGRGAIGVVELDRIAELDALRTRFVEEGVFVRPLGNVVYLTPSFTIAPDELAKLTTAIAKVLR